MSSDNNLVSKQDVEMVERALAILSEHFDTVHINCTRFEGREDGTVAINLGSGNVYARMGALREWIEEQ